MKTRSDLDNLDRLEAQVTSKSVEGILNVFANADDSLKMAQGELDYCDRKTQDVLHELELQDQTYHERAHAAIELRKIRQRRRAAKDIIDVAIALSDWCSANAGAVNQLKQCLGAMRKAEEKMNRRVYVKRTCDVGDSIIIAKR